MLLDTRDIPADIGLDAPARVGPMMRFARAARTRWRAMFLLTGAVLTVLGIVLGSGVVLIRGVVLLHGIGASGCCAVPQSRTTA